MEAISSVPNIFIQVVGSLSSRRIVQKQDTKMQVVRFSSMRHHTRRLITRKHERLSQNVLPEAFMLSSLHCQWSWAIVL
jgi:hypothetical protein